MNTNGFVDLNVSEVMLVDGGGPVTEAVFFGIGFLGRLVVETVRITVDIATLPARYHLGLL
ncbi:MAG: hypothetical protein FWF79_06440 [Defluviitaleaceae bacterium]|nr:hypothetical protein [Defluviitaleaceae bacterium]